MATYSTYSDFSTDAADTTATAVVAEGNSTDITGWTAISPTDTALRYFIIVEDAASEVGGKWCDHIDNGWGNTFGFLQFDEAPSITSTSEFEVLMRFKLTGTRGDAMPPICYFLADEPNDKYVGFRTEADDDLSLWFGNAANNWTAIGGSVAKSFAVDTWYWTRVYRSNATDGNKWSWKVWTGTYSNEGGWDLGDGGTGGTAGTYITDGELGIGSYTYLTDISVDYYSVGIGESAPGPAGGASIIPQIHHYRQQQ